MKAGFLTSIAAAVAVAMAREQSLLTDELHSGSVSGFDLARKVLGLVEPIDLPEDMQELVKKTWNDAWHAAPEKVLASLQPKGSEVNSQPPPRHINRKLGAHTVHKHPAFPNYELRLKDPGKLGIDTVQQYSGYIDILDEDKHFFFWLYESRSDPKNDPVILWLNGGPGCSSAAGEFFELGPAFLDANLTTTRNPYSWNNEATVIFLDQPVNVGYSYSSQHVVDTHMAGEDVYSFLEVLFDALPKYSKQPFHIAGESYAGKYIPSIGHAILSHPKRTFELASALIGNPMTDPANQAFSAIAMMCGDGGYPAVLEESVCDQMWAMAPPCEALLQACYKTNYDFLVCNAAEIYCSELTRPFADTGRNPYDISMTCENGCYMDLAYTQDYLRKPEVIEAAGSDIDDFNLCSPTVGQEFGFFMDMPKNEAPHLTEMLDAGIDVLVYDGAYDVACSWPGVYRVLERLPYEDHAEFNAKHAKTWHVDGKAAGESKTAGHLTWLKVYESGHLVPHDKPKEASAMLSQWLKDRKLVKGNSHSV